MSVPKLGLVLNPKPEEKEVVERTLVDELIQRAIDLKVAKSSDELIVRDIILMLDFDFTEETWEKAFTNTGWQVYKSITMPDRKIIGFYGIQLQNNEKIVTAIRFREGSNISTARTLDIWQIEWLYAREVPETYTKAPLIFEPNKTYHIEFYVKNTGTAKIVLLGKVVEPKGETIHM